MFTYVTFFSVGKDSETLIIDQFLEHVGDLVVWGSQEEYFAARQVEPEPIDGGVFSYGLATGTAAAPDAIIENRIVSFSASQSLVDLLQVLHSVVRAMRSAEWPEWLEE